MRPNKHLIIQLLIQDMKHEQLLAAFNKIGFHSDLHSLDIMDIVAELMGIQEDQMSWEWCDTYMDFIGHSDEYEVTGTGENLQPLAETCYMFLNSLREKELQSSKLPVNQTEN